MAARRGKSYDPELADVVCAEGPRIWAEVGELDPWDEALSRAPSGPSLDANAIHECLLVLADFADLKSPWTNGHSRAVAELVGEVCGAEAADAALVHDLGRVAVANTVWDKAGCLTRDERDRVETHTLVTDQLLRRIPHFAGFADLAVAAHERLDGGRLSPAPGRRPRRRGRARPRGHRLLPGDGLGASASRGSRAGGGGQRAAGDGDRRPVLWEYEEVERVLEAAGHARAVRPSLPAGLTAREAEVLGLLARGLTTRELASRLVISPEDRRSPHPVDLREDRLLDTWRRGAVRH